MSIFIPEGFKEDRGDKIVRCIINLFIGLVLISMFGLAIIIMTKSDYAEPFCNEKGFVGGIYAFHYKLSPSNYITCYTDEYVNREIITHKKVYPYEELINWSEGKKRLFLIKIGKYI